MTDEMLQWQTRRFEELATDRTAHVVHLRPEQVVEIAVDGVQRSSRYRGGWLFALPGCCATAATSPPPRPTPSRQSVASEAERTRRSSRALRKAVSEAPGQSGP